MAIAPAMRLDKVAPPDGVMAFQQLNSASAYEHRCGSEITRRLIVGDGNVDKPTERQLRGVLFRAQELREGSEEIHDAVYVVGTIRPNCVKVGMATDPLARLAQLQTGNPEKIYLHRVFWMLDQDAARQVEAMSHSFLEKKSKRMVGEWFECAPNIAHSTIINACRMLVKGFIAITPHYISEAKIERII